jgi:hypothetical protein
MALLILVHGRNSKVIILDASQLITTLTLKDFSSLTGDRNNLGVSNCCNGSWHVRARRGHSDYGDLADYGGPDTYEIRTIKVIDALTD